jgi:hypothetical protein
MAVLSRGRETTLGDIGRIILVSTDALGFPTASLVVTLRDGRKVPYEGEGEIMKFASRLARHAPEVATRIVRELDAHAGVTNYESVVF